MTRIVVAPGAVTPRAQHDPRGISTTDLVELQDGRLATVVGARSGQLVVELVKGAEAKSLDKAIKRFASFTGATPKGVTTLKQPPQDAVLFQVGDVIGIAYETVRDGKREHYYHPFKKSARPHLAASPDGRRLVILGGGFQFTDRGIVDA